MLPVRTPACRGMFRGCVTGFSLCLALAAGCERSQPPTSRAVPATTPPPAGTAPATAAPTVILGRPTGTFIDREDLLDLRLVCYNVGWNSIFPDVSASTAAKFARLMPALNPDILALQEVGLHPQDRDKSDARKWTADHVVKLMNQIAPLPKGATWHGWQGSDCVTVSKYPLKMTADTLDPPGERKLALALVDLPDEDFNVDLYILNNHFKCCDAEKNDPLRQQQSDALVAWLRDARTPGGKLDLPKATALVIVGDLNIVGSVQPIETLVRGDIQDEAKYGDDFAPDWDDSPLTDAHPLHNGTGTDDWTWRNDNDQWAPGRLDYVIYSDSVMDVVKKFALDTSTMTEEDLRATGLQKFDVTADDVGKEYDHLPLVVDFRVTTRVLDEPGE